MRLSEIGEQVRQCIEMIEKIYPSVLLEAFVVMPNHVHMLLVFHDFNSNPSLQMLIKQFKGAVTKKIEFSLWQDDSHVRAVLTAQRHRIVREYIKNNPKRWKEDKLYATEGEHRSPP